jgi:hypothetical protein
MKRTLIEQILTVVVLSTITISCDELEKALEEHLGCEANETQSCYCPNGEKGVQVCDPTDAGTWQACVCIGGCVASPEVCDGEDNDCNGLTDDAVSWVMDGDQDLYGDPSDTFVGCDLPTDHQYILAHLAKGDDCDDANPDVYAFDESDTEQCLPCEDSDSDHYGEHCVKGADCDDHPESGSACHAASDCETYYPDQDSDQYGDPDNGRSACELPAGYVENNDDCEDNPAVCGSACQPRAEGDTDPVEVCDGQDNDCDPSTPDGEDVCEFGCDPSRPESEQCFECIPNVGCCNPDGRRCPEETCCNGICGSFLENWGYRIRLTVNAGKVPTALEDFPVYVRLSDLGTHFFANVKADGSDIRVAKSDGITLLPFELVSLDKEGKGELYFLADSLSGDAHTTFFIYYSNPSATPYETGSVWERYTGVWHLNSVSGTILNSVENVEEGSVTGVTSDIGGIAGRSGLFTESDSFVEIDHRAEFDLSRPFTISAWVYPTDSSTNTILKKGDETVTDGFSLSITGGKVILFSNGVKLEDDGDLPLNRWSQVMVTWDSTSLSLYVNGGVSDTNATMSGLDWGSESSLHAYPVDTYDLLV